MTKTNGGALVYFGPDGSLELTALDGQARRDSLYAPGQITNARHEWRGDAKTGRAWLMLRRAGGEWDEWDMPDCYHAIRTAMAIRRHVGYRRER